MTDEAVRDVMPKYFGNVLSSFENGVQFDVRVKLAVQFLAAPDMLASVAAEDVATIADRALDLAGALLDRAAARGLLKDLPDNGELSAPLRHHIERSARVNVFGQVAQQRAIREETGVVAPVGASVAHPGMHG